jgi:hypothetical protein
MLQDRIQQIEARIRAAQNLPEETRRELLSLISSLQAEVESLAATRGEDAQSITHFADASTHEATRAERKPEVLQAALSGLTGSVMGLETSHPAIAQVVNRIAVTLSNMGI